MNDGIKEGIIYTRVSSHGQVTKGEGLESQRYSCEKLAKERGITTIGLLGKGGGEASALVNQSIIVPSKSTARIQEMHILIGHILCDLIEEGLSLKKNNVF